MPLPNHRGREATGGMASPEHRLKGPLLRGAGSSEGAVMPKSRLRGKGPASSEKAAASGTGSSDPSTKEADTAAGGRIGSSGGTPLSNVSNVVPPLSNVSNVIRSPRIRRNEPSTNSTPATTIQPRDARATKYTRPWTSSSPRGPSLGIGHQIRSTKTYRRRFSSLSINDADSLTSPPADASSATSHLCNTAADGSSSHFSNIASGICLGPMGKPGTGLSGELMPPSAGLTVKAGEALSLETPPDHSDATNLNAEAQHEHQSVTGSHVQAPRKHQAVRSSSGGMPPEHQVVLGLTGGTTVKHQAVTGSSGEVTLGQEAVTGSNRATAQKRRIKEKAQPEHHSVTCTQVETPRKHQAVTVSGGMPQEHQVVKGSTRGMAWGHKAVTGSNRATAPNHRIKEKAGRVSSEQKMAQKCYMKEKTVPSRQVRHPSGTERAGNNTKIPTARERIPTSRENRKTRSSHTCAGRSSDDSSAVHQSKGLTDDDKRRLTEEMMIKVQEADLLIQQLNESGVGERIDQDELQRYYEQLPSEPPRVDTYLELDDDQIKSFKMTQQWRQDDPYELEDDYHLCHLKEKLKCFVEDESKLDEDHILDYLDKEGLLAYIEKEDTLDWSFQYLAVAALDNYQRLVPQNSTGEYVHWDDYRNYFHKYEIELEYLDFWEELSKKLKWMEDYIHFGWPTLKWRRICSRGESQAIKIATGFSNITARLAVAAYYECIYSMNMEICWYRELDGVYFEIWKRVTKLKMSFREALNEVYELNKFPLREHVMKYALESDGHLMEMEFHNCTKGITEEVTEDKAQDLITDGIANLWTRSKFYAQYIRKKMAIARAIGIIPAVSP